MAKTFTLRLDGMEYEVKQQGRAILIDGKRFEPEVLGDSVTLEGHSHKVEIEVGHALVDGIVYPFETEGLERRRSGGAGVLKASPIAGDGAVTAIMPGLIIKVLVEAGQAVATGDPLVVLEAMKMESDICSPRDGVIKQVVVKAGDSVRQNQVLVIVE
jgi:glutaconyl-CoA/methylmalonyl-CoA decarboxylase subunit gamma